MTTGFAVNSDVGRVWCWLRFGLSSNFEQPGNKESLYPMSWPSTLRTYPLLIITVAL